MTIEEYAALPEGETVWFRPPFLSYAFPGVVRTIGNTRGIWVNFFGDGQCLFAHQEGRERQFASWITKQEKEKENEN